MPFHRGVSREEARQDIKISCPYPGTIHPQSFTFKEGLGRHHHLQIENDLRSALESEKL